MHFSSPPDAEKTLERPPALKEFVNKTFAQCTDSNRQKVEAELKGIIFDAFQGERLWTTDWNSVKLTRSVSSFFLFFFFCLIMLADTLFANAILDSLSKPLKRKKNGTKTISADNLDSQEEMDRRDKRLRRFQNAPGLSQSGSLADRLASTSFSFSSNSPATPEIEPEYDPVRFFFFFSLPTSCS
jgi:hypothetical protein